MIDGDSPTARLCSAGMAVDGDAGAAHALFEQAWDARRDAYEAAIAAHFLARHQPSAELRLHWNQVAVDQARLADGERARPLLASLYLNLGDSHLALGGVHEACAAAAHGTDALPHVAEGGYRDFVEMGLTRLRSRIAAAGGGS
ncbi:MAG: hypothetical protein ABI601_07105 [bacterium]